MEDGKRAPRRWRRASRLASLLALLLAGAAGFVHWCTAMPGSGRAGEGASLDAAGRALAARLRADVDALATGIGPRHLGRPEALARAAGWIERRFEELGYRVERQTFELDGQEVANLVVQRAPPRGGREVVVVGAHYDTCYDTPGADDNATGVAALLELARDLRGVELRRTLRLVAFVAEEPPHFGTDDMGSRRYAALCRERGDRVVAMLSLETLGFYTDEPGSQRYPSPLDLLYPDRGDFVAFVGNVRSRALVRRVVGAFRGAAQVPSEGIAAPALVPGIAWSDHWSFWREGYPALMVTDTAPFRNPSYHAQGDVPAALDFERFARAVLGLSQVLRELL